jgi:hypothetical protein
MQALYKLRDQFRDYLRKIEALKVQYRVADSMCFLLPDKIIYDQALQMGREGGVCELLKNFEKSEEMYSSGLSLIEQLLYDATEESDKEILHSCIHKQQRKITVIRYSSLSEETICYTKPILVKKVRQIINTSVQLNPFIYLAFTHLRLLKS